MLSEQTTEEGLLKYACQNENCNASDPEHFCIENCFGSGNIAVTKSGDTYTAVEESVSMPDAVAYSSPIDFDVNSLTYTRTFFSNVWNSWFVPFDATVSELADNGITEVATIESIHNYDENEDGVIDKTVLEVIKKTEGTVKGGVPYLVKTGASYTYPMAFSTVKTLKSSADTKFIHSETASASYRFEGTYSGLNEIQLADANHYSLNGSGVIVSRKSNILPQRWFIKELVKDNPYAEISPSAARSFVIRVIGEENEETGIRTIYPVENQTEEKLMNGVFDISGRRLAQPQRGSINIINGKKHFTK